MSSKLSAVFVVLKWDTVMLSIIILIISILGYFYFKTKYFKYDYDNNFNDDKNDNDDDEYIFLDLLPNESSSLVHRLMSITTITFFDGIINHTKLNNRIKKIVNLNPWLQGQLIKKKDSDRVYLKYLRFTTSTDDDDDGNEEGVDCDGDDSNTNSDDVFTIIKNKNLYPKMKLCDMHDIIRSYRVKRGYACINKKELLFKVTLIITGLKSFALIISLSHVIGDGHTMYRIYKMLSDDQDIIALNPMRDMDFDNKVKILTKTTTLPAEWLTSLGCIINSIRSLLFESKNTLLFDINNEWIEHEKTEYSKKNNYNYDNTVSSSSSSSSSLFISTNDIITSWVMMLTKCDIGLMTINYRNRLSNLTNEYAGNYQSMIIYQYDDYHSPSLIRASLQNCCRVISRNLPGFFASINIKILLITNWSTFYTELKFKNCKEILHLPVALDKLTDKSTISYGAILFKSNPTQYSILSSWYNITSEDMMLHHSDKIQNIQTYE